MLEIIYKNVIAKEEKIIAWQATNTVHFDKPGPSAIFQRRSGMLMEVDR